MSSDWTSRMKAGITWVFGLAVLVATSPAVRSQARVSGTWRAETSGGTPWEVALQIDGGRLVGLANSCASLPGTYEIFDTRIDGNTVTFKCRSGDQQRTLMLTGRVNDDEAVFSWKLQKLNVSGQNPLSDDPLFGISAPPQFVAKRVPDGRLAALLASSALGAEFSSAINIVEKDLTVVGELFVPAKVRRMQAVVVVVRYGTGRSVEQDAEWKRLAREAQSGLLFAEFANIGPALLPGSQRMGSEFAPEGLVALLDRLAHDSGHPELAHTPVVLWGHSGAGWFSINFAQRYPSRTAAFIHYRADYGGDMKILGQIPALLLTGAHDTAIPATQVHDLWKIGRSMGAPWTFATDRAAGHGDDDEHTHLKKADGLMIPWVVAVIRQRVSADGLSLRPVTNATAWYGNVQSAEIMPFGSLNGSQADLTWLPDEGTARAWQTFVK